MSINCQLQIAVTPYTARCVPDGIKAVEKFDPALLGRRPWPRVGAGGRGRAPEGGVGGEIVAEHCLITWRGRQLVYPMAENPQALAERPPKHDTEIFYYGSFLAQLDGQVAYQPSPGNWTHYFILVESPVAETHAVRFGPSQTAIVDPFVKHSMPIPLEGQFEFDTWHRGVNAVLQLGPDPAGPQPLVVNLCKVNRVAPISVRRQGLPPEEALPSKKVPKLPRLSHSFAKELKPLSDASPGTFAPYGQLITDFAFHNEQPQWTAWPGTLPEEATGDSYPGTLLQEFVIRWVPTSDGELLEFEGLSGSFAGEKGRPGVAYSPELGVYRADLLMARPDGTFFVHPSESTDQFAMAVALADPQTGEPLDHSLRAFIFRNGQAPRLHPGVWHSVPVPLAGSGPMIFTEVIAATNANLVANVAQEAGQPVQFVQAV